MSSIKKIAFVTGYVGADVSHIPKVPPGMEGHSYFITNVSDTKKQVELLGWVGVLIDIPIKHGPIGYRNQSTAEVENLLYNTEKGKQLKVFPQKFLPKKYDFIVWSDSKFSVNHVDSKKYIETWDKKFGVSFHEHPNLVNIQQEYDCSMSLDEWDNSEGKYNKRYRLQKGKIDKYIKEERSRGRSTNWKNHFQGGFIIYYMKNKKTLKFQNTWMKHINRCGIQDQISLNFVAQIFEPIIKEFKEPINCE